MQIASLSHLAQTGHSERRTPLPKPISRLNEATLISLIKIDTFSYENPYFETFSSDRSF